MTAASPLVPYVSHHCPSRLLAGLFSAQLVCTAIVYAQRSSVSFGAVAERQLEFQPLTVAVHPDRGRAEIVVASQDPPVLHLFRVSGSGEIDSTASYPLPGPVSQLVAVGTDSTGNPRYAGLSEGGRSVLVLTRQGHETIPSVYAMTGQPKRILAGNMSWHRSVDLLLFGKNTTGILTLLGGRRGRLQPGPVLFPDMSISDAAVTDLNGDGIPDLILLNWLKNTMEILYGISRFTFSEQMTVALPGEPQDLAITRASRRHMLRCAITLPEQRRVLVMEGDATGEFESVDSIACPGPPTGVLFADVNMDGIPDIVVSSTRGTVVALASGAGGYDTRSVFGAGAERDCWAVTDVDGDRKPDLVIAPPGLRELMVVRNASGHWDTGVQSAYLVGRSPRGVIATDVNGDGIPDIAVADMGSSALSLLVNRGNGTFGGQWTVPVPDRPTFVTAAVGPPGAPPTLVTSHTRSDRITVVRLAGEPHRESQLSMPTGPGPIVLSARTDSAGGFVEILARNANAREGNVSLSLFEQISGRQFLERSLRAITPSRITALDVGDFSQRGFYDLVFATYDRAVRQSTISISLGAPSFAFKEIQPLFRIPDSTSSTREIVSGFLDTDSYRDFLLVESPPRNAFGLAYGVGGGRFVDSLLWIEGVEPANNGTIILTDADGDGNTDIVYLDRGKRAVVAVYGEGGRRFSAPSEVAPAAGITSLAVAPLRNPSEQDLILSNEVRSTVIVEFHPFRRWQQGDESLH